MKPQEIRRGEGRMNRITLPESGCQVSFEKPNFPMTVTLIQHPHPNSFSPPPLVLSSAGYRRDDADLIPIPKFRLLIL